MNERIKKLKEQATSYTWNGNDVTEELDEQKFADLIVEECIREIGYKSVELLDIDFYPHYQERLKKYFGVEE